ncbi:MAG: S9 family peptidase, partial [Cyclobacteriaceae bacterium]|nr:S9 family peptidase [Cyclobacteriaceae bacterium]
GSPIRNDLYLIELKTGNAKKIKDNLRSYAYNISPKGNFFYWIDTQDSAWHAYSISNRTTVNLTGKIDVQFTHEIHDAPTPPSPYGIAGWTENDEFILIYDRYDIWLIDPDGIKTPVNLTNGRKDRNVYRYLKLDHRDRYIKSKKPLLLHTYNEVTRDEGYTRLTIRKPEQQVQLIEDAYKFSRPIKALDADKLIYTKQSFELFPDLLLSDISFKQSKQISKINPQQNEYSWGSGEIIKWTSLDGKELEGMLFKPDGFDPNKKYPMIVNFYEKSSQNLHNHRYPKPERSTINYSLYLSNGYVIFNPDVHYRIGYPGESCYNSVIPGVTKLIDDGFIDKDRIGVQGHSWGGYQIAYLITKTDMFAAAEAGAPVPNMISAYGGIRWWTGLSRMFQYEHTQSRIGGTLWEYPLRFIENSPIFFVDKINTPLLIMHNDADGHVPWYQGIELFVAMRRLGKPSWMLNYNGEPHWPLKRQNQIDFDIRMMQYFDHYLKDAPEPSWMDKGIPAVEKGINLGYESVEE